MFSWVCWSWCDGVVGRLVWSGIACGSPGFDTLAPGRSLLNQPVVTTASADYGASRVGCDTLAPGRSLLNQPVGSRSGRGTPQAMCPSRQMSGSSLDQIPVTCWIQARLPVRFA